MCVGHDLRIAKCVFVYVRSVCVVINGVACCGVYYVINCEYECDVCCCGLFVYQ